MPGYFAQKKRPSCNGLYRNISVSKGVFAILFRRVLHVLDLLTDAVILHLIKFRDEVHDAQECFFIDGVLGPEAFPSRIDHAGFDEDFHVVGAGGLGQREIGEDVAGGHFFAGQHVYDMKAGLVGESLEDGGKFFVTRFGIHGAPLFLLYLVRYKLKGIVMIGL